MKRNPFTLIGYISPEYFCNRSLETSRLLSAIDNQRNITLISTRRMGKTGLIMHTFDSILPNNTLIPIYFDIMGTMSLREFAEVFSNALMRSLSKTDNALKGFLKKLAALRPGLSFDPLTGEPRISLDIRTEEDASLSMDLIFSLIAKDKRSFIIAIDEFQQIANYPEKNVEAVLRSRIQQMNNMSVIFSGSKKHMLTEIFSQPSRPFFNSTEMMFLDIIPRNEYFDFIRSHFSKNGKSIGEDALECIASHTGLHTFYVQFLCNRLFGSFKRVTAREVDQTVHMILRENEPIYASYLNLLTTSQYLALRAIAIEGIVSSPTSGKFIAKHDLGASSTVAQSVKSLITKEFLQEGPEGIALQDKFFAQWIRQKTL